MKLSIWLMLLIAMTSCTLTKNWTKSNALIPEGLHDVEVINEKIAYAYSYGTGSFYKTTNASKHWEKIYQFDSIYFEQIQFLDKENGWLVGGPNKIYSTQDGGKNWTDRSLPKEFDRSYIYGMWFENRTTGYVAAIERNKKGFSSKIFQTQNGGTSWKLLNQLNEMILNLEKIDNVLFASGNNIILKNVDKKDWSLVFEDTSKQVGQIRDIEQNDAGKIYASSFNGFIIEVNHNPASKKQITKNRIRNLISINDNEWIAVGDSNKEIGNLLVSRDNGITWLASPESFSDIHRIQASDKKLWIVGKEGLIMTKKK